MNGATAHRTPAAAREEARPKAGPAPKAATAAQPAPGNQELQSLLAAGLLRAKTLVGAADDPAESEADRLAAAAMRGTQACHCAGSAEPCPRCRASADVGALRRKARHPGAGAASLGALGLGSGRRLGEADRRHFEARFGADFSAVRIHDDTPAHRVARHIEARAFAVGQDIGFASGGYQPHLPSGRELLTHELAHVALGHTGVRRVEDSDLAARHEYQDQRRQEAEQARQRHAAWGAGVDRQYSRDLLNQSTTIGAERERQDFALTAQRAAVMDAAAGGEGWLNATLHQQGYVGPGLADLKRAWGEAMVAAEALKLGTGSGEVDSQVQLESLRAIPAFYLGLHAFALAAEQAHKARVDAENERRRNDYRDKLARYEEGNRMDRIAAQGARGEPGMGGFRAGLALARGSPPSAPAELKPPPAISGEIAAANARVYRAQAESGWGVVADDVNRLGKGMTTLVAASLAEGSGARVGLEYLEQLDARLAAFEATHEVVIRIPAVFYPEDRTLKRRTEDGKEELAPEAIPWQFYLINTGVRSHDQPARAGGEWVLVDLTSGQRFENRAPASDFDSARLQQGDLSVDPPLGMFGELNSRLRFPTGRLYFMLPSRKGYVLKTTEPWSLSDWLSAIGMALAAIALVASVIATGGASAPAAVAFYATVGAAAAGVGSTLANLHEREQQGILTSDDIDKAMLSIAIDIVTVGAMGLGRLVAMPAAAARIGLTGERFIALQRVTQVLRAGAISGDVYQAWSFTSGLIAGFNAIAAQPGLSDAERDRLRGQLVRRALLTGALLAVALRGDVKDFQAGRNLRISHVDADGAMVVHGDAGAPHAEADSPHEHARAPGASTAAHAAPHAEVTGTVHANADRSGAALTVGPQSHALSAAGSGPRRDFYFCSDLCSPIAQRLSAIVEVLPRQHPERAIVQDLLSRARGASQRLKSGKLTQQQADDIARQLSDDIARNSRHSELFSALMNTAPEVLASHGQSIRRRLASDLDVRTTHLEHQSQTQAANRGSSRGRDATAERDAHSPLEQDVLGGFNIQNVERPGKKLQPIHFDVGNFSHTHAEALVPGLPRGLSKEVPVTLADGSVGRADRARFVYDADGDRIGVHVYEVKPNTPDNVQRGQQQVQGYVQGLRVEIEAGLRAKGKAMPTVAPDGGALYSGQVLTYDVEQMNAVLRALRGSRRDAAQMAQLEAIARAVFGAVP